MFLSLLLTLAVADTKPAYARPQLIVEPADLAAGKVRRDSIVLDVRPRRSYEVGHVPGAVWVDLPAWNKAVQAGEAGEKWVERIGKLGIDGKRPVIVYDDNRSLDASRAWWILKHRGVRDVRLLNGGWKGWLAAGGKSSREEPAVTVATPELKHEPGRLATGEQLLEELKKGKAGQILDSRSKAEHCGEKKTAKRSGTIPEARHLEWSDTIDPRTGKFRTAPELARLFRDAGIDLDRPATTFCQSGGRASVLAFVVELMGGKPARNYYRSWSEWGNRTDTPIVTPKKD